MKVSSKNTNKEVGAGTLVSPQKKVSVVKVPKDGKVFEASAAEVVSPGVFATNEQVPVTNFRRDFENQAKKFREMLKIGETPKRDGAYPEYTNGAKPLNYANKSEGQTKIMPDLEKRIKTVNESVLSSEQNALITELVELGKKDPEQLEEILQEASNPSASSTEGFGYSKKDMKRLAKNVTDAFKMGIKFTSSLQKQLDKANIKLKKKFGADFSTSADKAIELRRRERGMTSTAIAPSMESVEIDERAIHGVNGDFFADFLEGDELSAKGAIAHSMESVERDERAIHGVNGDFFADFLDGGELSAKGAIAPSVEGKTFKRSPSKGSDDVSKGAKKPSAYNRNEMKKINLEEEDIKEEDTLQNLNTSMAGQEGANKGAKTPVKESPNGNTPKEKEEIIKTLFELSKKSPELCKDIIREVGKKDTAATEGVLPTRKNWKSFVVKIKKYFDSKEQVLKTLQEYIKRSKEESEDKAIDSKKPSAKEGASKNKINYSREILYGRDLHNRALEEANADVVHPSKLTSKYDTLTMPKKEAYTQLLARLRLLSYPQYLSQLKSITKSDRLSEIFNEGFNEYSKVEISRDEVEIPVARLIPTQNQLNMKKAMEFPFSGEEPVSSYFVDGAVTIVAPIITFNKTFIIDGHHRWAQIAIMNPRATVSCIDFQSDVLTPIQFLKLIQGAIAMEEGEVILADKTIGVDLYKSSVKAIKEYIADSLKDSVKGAIAKKIKATSNEDALDFIIANALSLKYNNLPAISSPNREKMPQVYSSPASLDTVLDSPAIAVATESTGMMEGDTASLWDEVKLGLQENGNNMLKSFMKSIK